MIERFREMFPFGKRRILIFHHLPKCGGTSMVETLKIWFPVVTMYRRAWTETPPHAPKLRSLRDSTVLVGHFELPGNHWTDLYPEALRDPDIRVMTFLRHPLQLQASLFRYERKHGSNHASDFPDHLTRRPNYMAGLLQANDENWREVIDRYWFIGTTERAQEGFDALAKCYEKPLVSVARTNETTVTGESNPENLPEEIVRAFEEANALDYKLYAEAKRRFEAFAAKLPVQ